MSCRVCHRGSCTETFHSLEEQDAAERKRDERPPKCTGFRCDADGTIDSGDFGHVCPQHMREIENTVGT